MADQEEVRFITWEQAVSQNKLIPIAEQYKEMVREVLMYFGTNTLAQVTYMGLYYEAMELYGYYRQKDYSKFLFDKMQALFDQIAPIQKELEPLQKTMSRFASIYTNKIIKEIETKKKVDHDTNDTL